MTKYKDICQKIKSAMEIICLDFEKSTTKKPSGTPNFAAAQRVRVNSIELSKLFKEYRKESIKEEKRVKAKRSRAP